MSIARIPTAVEMECRHGDVRAWSWQHAAGCGTAIFVFLPLGSAAATGDLAKS